ncbi:ATP-binding protein [Candidatus Omnitrophota bacterium]
MEVSKELERKLSQLFNKWLVVDSHRKLYGPGMPQVRAAMEDLVKSLEEILAELPEFSVVTKKSDIDVVGEGWRVQASTLRSKSIVADIKKIFDRLNVNSITFKRGLEAGELGELFSGLAMSPEELSKQKGLKGYLESKKAVHIQVDQFSFKLLKEGETIGGAGAKGPGGDGKGPGAGGEGSPGGKGPTAPMNSTQLASIWKDYLQGKITKWDLVGKSSEAVEVTKQDPKELIKVLKRVMKKQKKIESFLADLEGKLTDLGFAPKVREDIRETLQKELNKAKKVTVAEDELARLKKLEKDFQQTLEERVESTLTEVKKLNKKLSDERERMNAILRQSSQGVIVIDKEGKIISLNGPAEKALGVGVKDGQKKSLKDMMQEGQVLSITSDWHKESDEFTPKEVKVVASSGQDRDTIADSSAVIENEDGKAIGMVSALPGTVQMQQLEKRKGEILDVLGHDLRAPICAAKQSLAVLTVAGDFLEGLSPQQKELVMISKRNVERMEKLINSIMDARQLETGKISLRMARTDVSKLMTDSVDSLKVWAESKKISLSADIKQSGEFLVDPEKVYQVVTNLVSNAVKFTPEGGTVELRLAVKDKEAEISVIDSGIGIKTSDLERIFKKYEQVSLRSPKGESGLGLGLAICKSIVELHGGRIRAESKEGKGSTFVFTLPLATEEEN